MHDNPLDASNADEIVCCQASNAASCALQLHRQLAKYTTPLVDQAHIPPIPTVTTIGASVTIWIAYYTKNMAQHDRFKEYAWVDDGYVSHSALRRVAPLTAKRIASYRSCKLSGKEI